MLIAIRVHPGRRRRRSGRRAYRQRRTILRRPAVSVESDTLDCEETVELAAAAAKLYT